MGTTDSKNLSHKIYEAIKNKETSHLKFKLIKGYKNENLNKLSKTINYQTLNF